MKKMKSIAIVLMAILGVMFLTNVVYGAETQLTLNITDERKFTPNESHKYTVLRGTKDYSIFKIGEKKEGSFDFGKALYCLRAGLGFGDSETMTNISNISDVIYTKKGNLKTEATEIIKYFTDEVNFGTIDTNSTKVIDGNTYTFTPYNSILWIIDNMYLPKDENSETMKNTLLTNAGIEDSDLTDYSDILLTDDDIEVVQQMALWYFSNYDTNGEGTSFSLSDSVNLGNLLKVDGNEASARVEEPYNTYRATQINKLYKYLISEAIKNSESYGKENTRPASLSETNITIEKTNPSIMKNGNFYIVGPFDIKKEDGNKSITIDSVVLKDAKGTAIPEKNNNSSIISVIKNANDVATFKDTLKETVGEGSFYIKIESALVKNYDLTDMELIVEYSNYETEATLWTATNQDQPVLLVDRNKNTDTTSIKLEYFDLSLRKFITSINGTELVGNESRIPQIDLSNLNSYDSLTGAQRTTATYTHPKNALTVKNGDKVIYTIRVYNEGQTAGEALEITDLLPDGLKFVVDSQVNTEYGWKVSADGKAVTTDYLKNTTIKAYNPNLTTEDESIWQKANVGESGLYYADVKIECEVIAKAGASDKYLKNIAEITKASGTDRDSVPNNVDKDMYIPPVDNSSYQEDDDDYEDLILNGVTFDLSLRKFITKVNGEHLTESRTPVIDLSRLNKLDGSSRIKTAVYTHSKVPVVVRRGDIVTYKIRIYNESEIDGYATKISDYLPEGLGLLLDYKTNTDNYWKADSSNLIKTIPLVGENGFYSDVSKVKNLKLNDFYQKDSFEDVNILAGNVEIYTEALKEEIIKAYNSELVASDIASTDLWQKDKKGENGLYYREVEVTCIVLADNIYQDEIRNIAEIKEDKAVDENGDEIILNDRDSTPNNVNTNIYTPPADNSTYQEDDDDYEPLILKYFDLALRKFITGVNDEIITSRIPQISFDEDGEVVYNHDKTPVNVTNGDLVTYTIRVYNEGTIAGYAEEIADDIPEGLTFIPENSVNRAYGWKMYYYDENDSLVETEDAKKAEFIKTTYLSSQDSSNIITEFNKKEMNVPDYKDVKIVFKVEEKAMGEDNTSRIITNKAHITKDSDDDYDSTPDKWIEGEDDQDREHVYVKYFDLSLLKWVTKTIVTVDNKTTTTETGFMPNQGLTEQTGDGIRDNKTNEPIAKVEIDKKKIKSTSVKFVYNIKVTNEGELAGQATEITDYIPEGLEFYEEDNVAFGWAKDGDNKVTTRVLDGITLNPGESSTIEIVFRWKNDVDNIGIKTNIAEITEDYNDRNSKDIDSVPDTITPDNYNKEQQDDDDYALVILSIKTGKESSYIGLTLAVLTIITGGIVLIKKYVLV